MNATDVRKKSDNELAKILTELERELHEFRFGMSGGRTKDVRKARTVRHDIARIKLVLTERARS